MKHVVLSDLKQQADCWICASNRQRNEVILQKLHIELFLHYIHYFRKQWKLYLKRMKTHRISKIILSYFPRSPRNSAKQEARGNKDPNTCMLLLMRKMIIINCKAQAPWPLPSSRKSSSHLVCSLPIFLLPSGL